MKRPRLRVLLLKIGQKPTIVEIAPTPEAVQAQVGGASIELVPLAHGLLLCCCGVQDAAAPVGFVHPEVGAIRGTSFVCRHDHGELVSLSDEDVALVLAAGGVSAAAKDDGA